MRCPECGAEVLVKWVERFKRCPRCSKLAYKRNHREKVLASNRKSGAKHREQERQARGWDTSVFIPGGFDGEADATIQLAELPYTVKADPTLAGLMVMYRGKVKQICSDGRLKAI